MSYKLVINRKFQWDTKKKLLKIPFIQKGFTYICCTYDEPTTEQLLESLATKYELK
jgi:hypothetical protein